MNKSPYAFMAVIFLLSVFSGQVALATGSPAQTRPLQGEEVPGGFVQAPNIPASAIATGEVLQMMIALVLVLGAIVLVMWLLRRVQGLQRNNGTDLRILGGVSLGTRERAVLVQVGEQQLLVGVCSGQIRTLHVLETPVAVPQKPLKNPFSQHLSTVLKRGESP
ncbi:flagellar biosynthetic protein FliO [Nitrosococcus watsonii]|uniref:Flagellar protein n=1 Tax=Nitrosococcus watsoni (strain C-113) TaxID=105559 RepID=D8K4G9_NITWC|nr:flagellar biosynthetic protein FliO [Nitrosococcus watsonii]ADJ27866.1 flagellar biosynthetic protein FliO [Nitrosococcus watsonii C-113]